MLDSVCKIQSTDRWNSFDQFARTAAWMGQAYERTGAAVQVHRAPTGGPVGTGRWIVQEAVDVRAATLRIVRPVRRSLGDYRRNPWHVALWSAATPPGGQTYELITVDETKGLERLGPDALMNRLVLTKMNPRDLLAEAARRGAAGIMSDCPVPNHARATGWGKLGWGGIPLDRAGARLVGLMISAEQGRVVRKLLARHGTVAVHTRIDCRKYAGHHDVVSGIIAGRDDPDDEVCAVAHAFEPGALDNASGVAVCVEIARVLESLIRRGLVERPRRSIRLLHGYECYGFFHWLEHQRRFQTPLAGVCLDSVGARPAVCDGRLAWHATVPMSAGFVDRIGWAMLRGALREKGNLYRLAAGPFVSTSDTLLGDPQYGFPCPWLTTSRKLGKSTPIYDAYHSSADTPALLSIRGLEICATAMAGYLYYLANATTADALELAKSETRHFARELRKLPPANGDRALYLQDRHRVSLGRLKRWLWGGDRREAMQQLGSLEQQVQELGPRLRSNRARRPRAAGATARIVRRTAPLSPTLENTPPAIAARIRESGLHHWALFWADGRRSVSQIAAAVTCETGRPIEIAQVEAFFLAHADLGYVTWVDPNEAITGRQIRADLRALGIRRGMDLIVHSSLSKMGHVLGGADTVVDALVAVIGPRGTLMMPSFNHRQTRCYNPLATPTVSGAIPNAMWRRPEAIRSLNPTHAVAAIGPKAEQLCRGHLEAGGLGLDSPIGRLIRSGGYILSLGVPHTTNTAYHVAEVSVPCGCIDQFGHNDSIVDEEGRVRAVRGLVFRSASCPVPEKKLDTALARGGRERRGHVGGAPSTLVKAQDLFDLRRRHLARACPVCRIKPRGK